MCAPLSSSGIKYLLCSSMMLSFLAALGAFILMIIVPLNPFYAYTETHIYFSMMYLLSMGLLIAAGLSAFCTLKIPKCHIATFWLLLVSIGWLLGLGATNGLLLFMYSPNDLQANCADRYQVVSDLVEIGSPAFTDKLCSHSCECNYTRDSAITFNKDIVNGAHKLQECTDVWRGIFDRLGAVMEDLETSYGCTGFCEVPTNQNRFSFRNINDQNKRYACHGNFSAYLASNIGSVMMNTFQAAFAASIAFVCLIVVELSSLRYGNPQKQDRVFKVTHFQESTPNDSQAAINE